MSMSQSQSQSQSRVPEIILYHYKFSPYARRLTWYLSLRRIPYTQCLQPVILPRPDLVALGTKYRRIPLLSIGRDIYLDTRLILATLESLFPASAEHPPISAAQKEGRSEDRTMERLLQHWCIDNGLFARAAALIPADSPLLTDPKFRKDREDYSGTTWTPEALANNRREALPEVHDAFRFLENVVLADGRPWVAGDSGPSLGDIEAVWPFHWLNTMKGALPAGYIDSSAFPRTFAWMARFDGTTKEAAQALGKPKTVKGAEAAEILSSGSFVPGSMAVRSDPSGLKEGAVVEVWPIDSGSRHRDQGRLVKLDENELVIESSMQGGKGTVRIHAPRHGFRIRGVAKEGKL